MRLHLPIAALFALLVPVALAAETPTTSRMTGIVPPPLSPPPASLPLTLLERVQLSLATELVPTEMLPFVQLPPPFTTIHLPEFRVVQLDLEPAPSVPQPLPAE